MMVSKDNFSKEELEESVDVERIIQSIEQDDLEGFRSYFLGLHRYEQAEVFLSLDESLHSKLYHYLSPDEVALFMDNIDPDEEMFERIFDRIDSIYAADILTEMSYDNAVDILSVLSKEKVASLLVLMPREDAKEMRALLNYEEDSAGGIMTTEYISVPQDMTVREALIVVKEQAPEAETIYYVFVIDHHKELVGVLSLRDLIVNDDDEYIEDIMVKRVVSVSAMADQEAVALKMRDYDLLALPVVDYQNHLLGIITADDIMDVIDEEASEDYSKLAGVNDIDNTTDTFLQVAKKRLPWLIALTVMGMITASILGQFEETMAKVALLAAFIPIIGGMAGNSGTQSLAVAVRGISTGEIKEASKMKIAMREMGSGFISGFVCGLILFVIITILYQEVILALIVAISLMLAMTVATLAGAIVPLVMHKFNIDPAVASGPFITTINDIISMLIYFGLATTFMSYLT